MHIIVFKFLNVLYPHPFAFTDRMRLALYGMLLFVSESIAISRAFLDNE